MKKLLCLCVWSIVGASVGICAVQPMEILKPPVEEIVSLLNDPKYKDPAQKEAQEDKIWQIVRGLFDFTEMSKRTLARHWLDFSPPQRKEFTDVFGKFLGDLYIEKIQSGYQNEKVVFTDQEMVSDDKAVVKTKIVRPNAEIPVDYSMIREKDGWRIYDVNIEGVSLVKNYRTQFNDILFKESPEKLIERLKKKKVE